ncbi:MAG: hypothetical protein IKK00_07260 [Oscillospiraceae bacterium]|nr:hypothetical protein [Oscillospiraceae bacterium]
MGFGDRLKKTFGKQECAFCGNEVGMLKRDKIKGGEFICHDCRRTCSRYIQVYRLTKDELLGHMEAMKRQNKLYEMLEGKANTSVPSAGNLEAIEFYDDYGMFRIRDRDKDGRYPMEFIRYDQVASYERYLEEGEPDEPGKPKVFGEWGVDITLVGADELLEGELKGRRAHPYINETLRVRINDRDKHIGELEVNQIISHFDYIFGVNDNTRGLFNFGLTKQQKREGEALKAMGGLFGAAIKAAKDGGEISEETKTQVQDAMNKADDAATGGLARYSRLADEAEAKI